MMAVTVILLFLCIRATSPEGVGAVISDGGNGTRLTETNGDQRQGIKPKTNTEIFSATLLHDTVFVNARFSDHIVAEPVAFGVLTVRFTNNFPHFQAGPR